MAVSIARAIAYEVLTRVETQSAWAADALHGYLSRAERHGAERAGSRPLKPVKKVDAALATELVYGVIRWQRLLDFLVDRQASRSSNALDPEVRRALRLGAYQLLFLDRVPPSAAVNESVELAKAAGKGAAAGFVNAVLRRLPRGPYRPENLERSLPEGLDQAARFGILYSHPDWPVERWLAAYGPENTRALLEANNRPLPISCAVLDSQKREKVADALRREGLIVEPGRLLADALIVRGGSVTETRAFRDESGIVVQDEASQAVPLILDVKHGQSVLDLCAAPGNKTLRLAVSAGPNARMVAADLYFHRLREVRGQFQRTGIPAVHLVALDATRPLPFAVKFDRILVDAPCSGTGTLARNPEIRWRLAPDDIGKLRSRQESILTNALNLLAPHGQLVYATCSLEPEENEQLVRRALHCHQDLRLASPPADFACHLARGIPGSRLFDSSGFFRTFPPETSTDGFFAAILRRR